MKDDYNIARYLPAKYRADIEEIDVVADFDYNKNRSVQRYYAYFKNGERVSANGIENFKKQVLKKYGNVKA